VAIRQYKDKYPVYGDSVYIDEGAIVVGDVNLGEDASLWPFVAARGDVNYIKLGKRSNVQDGSVLHVTRKSNGNPLGFPLIIGDDVTIGHKCMLHGCELGNRILVGMGTIIMDGVTVEDDVFIGAGSLIPPNKRLESGFLYVGNPAVKKRKLKDLELAFLTQSAVNYVALKNEYLGVG
jgi:carbonic anhydrase/acetyltransferase-like protein (isoleucine patch superfamily)